MINNLRVLKASGKHVRTDGQSELRDETSKKESKGNVRDQKHQKRNEEYHRWLHQEIGHSEGENQQI